MEYDLDRDDEAWLARFNGDQERMTHRRLEELLWKLDCANAEATNSVLSAASECCRLQGCKVARPCAQQRPLHPQLLAQLHAGPRPCVQRCLCLPRLHICTMAWQLQDGPMFSSTCDCHCCTLHNFVGLTA